jgi:hypothetical protein
MRSTEEEKQIYQGREMKIGFGVNIVLREQHEDCDRREKERMREKKLGKKKRNLTDEENLEKKSTLVTYPTHTLTCNKERLDVHQPLDKAKTGLRWIPCVH